MAQFLIWNGPAPTTAGQATVTTGASIKTMLQVKPSATLPMRIRGWRFSTSAPSALSTGLVELVETDVAATVTAHVAAGLVKYDSAALNCGDPTSNLIQVGTTSTGYTSAGEGSITATRVLDAVTVVIPTTGGATFYYQFPLGEQPELQLGLFARIRVTFDQAVNMRCAMLVELG